MGSLGKEACHALEGSDYHVPTNRFYCYAQTPGTKLAPLCKRFGISRKTAYKWLERYRRDGVPGLADRPRSPKNSPHRFADTAVINEILRWRDKTGWGGRKIRAVLLHQGHTRIPAASTISEILKRYGRIRPEDRRASAMQRFEAAAPNDLWQMDFKGTIRLRNGACDPLTVLDDHSRFSLGVRACPDHGGETVKAHLTHIFRTYGLPWRILADNGKPWAHYNKTRVRTYLGVWLMQLGIDLIHSRPYHPQTCGKDERFHRTLKQELTGREMNCRFDQCQALFDEWRHQYNTVRPHEALEMQTPASRYCLSPRPFPEVLPPPAYDSTDEVRKARDKGRVRYRGVDFRIGSAFAGHPVAVRPTERDGIMAVYFYRSKIAELNLYTGKVQ